MTEQFWISLFDSLKIFGPAVILPIVILYLTNRNSRKIKKLELEHASQLKLLEQQHDLSRLSEARRIENSFITKNERQGHEKLVHTTLIKILFEVQRLHINLSGNCVDFKCIDDCTKEFKETFTKYQNIIAENQIYLSSHITNTLYKFYKRLGELLIELKDIQTTKNFDLAIVAVYEASTELADYIIQIQGEFVSKRADLENEFNSIELEDFKACCGKQPPEQDRTRYYQLKGKIMNLPEPIEPVKLTDN